MELYDVRRTKFVQAHSTALACLALSLDGKLLATASERGTLVRIFSTNDGTKLQARMGCHFASGLLTSSFACNCPYLVTHIAGVEARG